MSTFDPAEIDRMMGLDPNMMGGAGSDPAPGASQSDPLPQNQVQNTGLNQHAQPGQPTATGGLTPEMQAMKDQLDAATQQIEELKKRPPLPTETQMQAPPQPQTYFTPEQAKKKLEEAFINDPGGTMMAFGQYIEQSLGQRITAEIAKATGGIAQDVSGGNIDAYRAKMAADPVMAPALEEFDRLVIESRGSLQPGNMSKQLDGLASMALGNTLRKRPPNARDNPPPAWGGGQSSSADSGQQQQRRSGLTQEMQDYVATMKDLGIPNEVIAERLKNWDNEGGIVKS